MGKSMSDVACEYLKTKEGKVSFVELWNHVCQVLGFTADVAKEKVGKFYTNISLDGRFVNCPNNTWDLRERVKFADVHIDMKDVYQEIGGGEGAEEEKDLEDSAAEDLKEEEESAGVESEESEESDEIKEEPNDNF